MRKIVVLFVCLFLGLGLFAQSADKKNNTGEYQYVFDKLAQEGISYEDNAEKYVFLFSEAMANPDEFILAESTEEVVILDDPEFWHKIVNVTDYRIIYDSRDRVIRLIETPYQTLSLRPFPIVLIILIIAVFLVFSSVYQRKNKK